MPEQNQSSAAEHTCSVCGVTSEERILISAEKEGGQVWICVRCLPAIIHGAQ